MLKTLNLLMRGAIADNAQAVHDANAVAILRQQIRDAAGALATARRELAVAMSYRAAEERAIAALGSRIESVSDGVRKALSEGREDLGEEAAILIAALEDEKADRQTATDRFGLEVERLKILVGTGQDRLRDLDRGMQTARATEAVRRAGMNGRRMVNLSTGALGEAEDTLRRLLERQSGDQDFHDALADLETGSENGVEARLEKAGCGRRRTDPKSVLERLRETA